MDQKIKNHLQSLSELDGLKEVRRILNSCISDLKSKDKAVKAEFEFNGDRKGLRGGKRTTLSAKAVNRTQAYQGSIELLKKFVNNL